MELKSLEDWVVEKNFKSVPDVVDVASFGGPTREYQVRIDPEKLIAYGLSIGQVEQQLANNNANAGGSFIEAGLQQVDVRRLRPIIVTSSVATLGLLPAALSHAIGSDSQRPFAIVIVGGLISGLLLSIFLLPTLYAWVAGEGDILPPPEGESH